VPALNYMATSMARPLPSLIVGMSTAPRACLAVLLSVLSLFAAGSVEAGPTITADVEVALVVEIDDVTSWLSLHQEVLAAASESSRPLFVTLPARTGGRRMVGVERPKFTASLGVGQGTSTVKVTIFGKINGADALSVVTPFEQAAFEVQAGAVPNEATLVYGLSAVIGRLLELHFSRT
jgi:hypothetical protein